MAEAGVGDATHIVVHANANANAHMLASNAFVNADMHPAAADAFMRCDRVAGRDRVQSAIVESVQRSAWQTVVEIRREPIALERAVHDMTMHDA